MVMMVQRFFRCPSSCSASSVKEDLRGFELDDVGAVNTTKEF